MEFVFLCLATIVFISILKYGILHPKTLMFLALVNLTFGYMRMWNNDYTTGTLLNLIVAGICLYSFRNLTNLRQLSN